MAWGDPGITIRRNIIDQQATITQFGPTTQLLPFTALRTVGYLRGLWLYSPPTTGVAAIPTGANTMSGGSQFPQQRPIKRVTLNLQASINIVDVDGIDIFFLSYIASGRKFGREAGPWNAGFSIANGTLPTTDQYPYNWPTRDNSLLGGAWNYGPVAQYNTAGPTYSVGYSTYIPISEFLIWPNTPVGNAGGVNIYTDMPQEFGLIFMQNDQQNLSPQITLGSSYGTTAESVIQSTLTASAVVNNQQWSLEAEYYDVPVNVVDRPNELQSRYLIVRQAQDQPASGQAAVIKHRAAGVLLAVIYVFYNDGAGTGRGTLVDITQTPAATLAFRSGATTSKIIRTVQMLSNDAFDYYGNPPPGIAVLDFRQSGIGFGWGQGVDTGEIVDVRSEWSALPAAVTRVHYVELRAIPIRRPVAMAPGK